MGELWTFNYQLSNPHYCPNNTISWVNVFAFKSSLVQCDDALKYCRCQWQSSAWGTDCNHGTLRCRQKHIDEYFGWVQNFKCHWGNHNQWKTSKSKKIPQNECLHHASKYICTKYVVILKVKKLTKQVFQMRQI